MAYAPKKISDMTAAAWPVADSEQLAGVQDDANVAFTVGQVRRMPGHVLAALPSAATAGEGATIFVTDATGGPVPVYSDGTDWLRFDDNTVVD